MPKKMDPGALTHLVDELCTAHGENLVSVVLYGSAAAGDHIEQRSDQNILIVLNRITTEDLRRSQGPIGAWQAIGQPPPVYFSVAELDDAADVFPIEFLQMEQARKVLHGRDPFEFIKISHTNLRHQTEYELRTRLIQLRRMYIPASTSIEKLSNLMSDSLVSFAALFRAVLILHGQDPPITKPATVRASVRLLELDAAPFERIFELRANSRVSLTETEANEVFAAYMAQIERVIEVVDRLDSK